MLGQTCIIRVAAGRSCSLAIIDRARATGRIRPPMALDEVDGLRDLDAPGNTASRRERSRRASLIGP
jgi:hypothetical protein